MTQRKRLAMVACHGPAEGPWALSRGYEKAIRVTGLEDREHVVMEVVSLTAETVEHLLTTGVHPFPSDCSKFRFIKKFAGDPTKVEILFE